MGFAEHTISDAAWAHCERVLQPVLALGPLKFLDEVAGRLAEHDIQAAVAARDSAALFNWIVALLARQGVSNHAAITFAERNGSPRFAAVIAGGTEVAARASAATGISPVVGSDGRPAPARPRTIDCSAR